jgi:hypothetical protein
MRTMLWLMRKSWKLGARCCSLSYQTREDQTYRPMVVTGSIGFQPNFFRH